MKSECLNRTIFFGERNHQGLGNNLLKSSENAGRTDRRDISRNRLGGMLRYYYRQAA